MAEPFLDYLGIGAFLEHKHGVEVSPIILMNLGKFYAYTRGLWLSNSEHTEHRGSGPGIPRAPRRPQRRLWDYLAPVSYRQIRFMA